MQSIINWFRTSWTDFSDSFYINFIKDDRYYYFEIREAGQVVVIENEAGVGFINQPTTPPEQPEEPEEPTEPPKTGDDFNIWLWVGAASASFGAIILIVIRNRKKRIPAE